MRKVLPILLAAANAVLCVLIVRGPSYSARVAAALEPSHTISGVTVTDAPFGSAPSAATLSPAQAEAPATGAAGAPVPAVYTNPFSDVKEGDWYYDAVLWAAGNGLVSGETFAPNDTATRAQALTFLWRAKGKPAPNLRVSPYTDVADGDYYFEPVLWAFENGLVSTATDGQFHPDNAATRAQAATFLYRAENGSGDGLANPFSDVRDSDWYAAAAKWAYNRGIVGSGSFDPGGSCTRAVYITFLYRCYGGGAAPVAAPSGGGGTPARDWSIIGKPSEEDFDWYWDFLVGDATVPYDAVPLFDLAEIAGNWKTLTLYLDHDGETLIAIELATIGIATESTNLIYQWDQIVFDGDDDWYDESGDPPLVYDYELPGDGSMTATAIGNAIELYMFWEHGGKQYALGEMSLPDGTGAYLALVRP